MEIEQAGGLTELKVIRTGIDDQPIALLISCTIGAGKTLMVRGFGLDEARRVAIELLAARHDVLDGRPAELPIIMPMGGEAEN